MVLPVIEPSRERKASWYALYTKSRHEKLVHQELQRKGIESFLPLRHLKRRWSDRTQEIEEPLFKGYLFVRTDLKNRFDILNTRGSVKFVGFNSGPVSVPEKDLEAVKCFVRERISIDPFPYLAQGDRVYVRSGPLKGIEGLIARKDRHSRLVISLDMLFQSVSVEIDEALIEKI